MAYQLIPLPNGRYQVRCVPGDIVHIAFDALNNRWTVEEDPKHQTFRSRDDAVGLARIIGRDPDFQ
jgi:hypothetical protein